MSVFGIAAQLILMKGPFLRLECSCSALATSSLPVPDSPVMSTVEGVSATLAMMPKMICISGLSPTRPKPPRVQPSSCGSGRASRRDRWACLTALWTMTRICSCSNGFSM
jgi:hypothetical protein